MFLFVFFLNLGFSMQALADLTQGEKEVLELYQNERKMHARMAFLASFSTKDIKKIATTAKEEKQLTQLVQISRQVSFSSDQILSEFESQYQHFQTRVSSQGAEPLQKILGKHLQPGSAYSSSLAQANVMSTELFGEKGLSDQTLKNFEKMAKEKLPTFSYRRAPSGSDAIGNQDPVNPEMNFPPKPNTGLQSYVYEMVQRSPHMELKLEGIRKHYDTPVTAALLSQAKATTQSIEDQLGTTQSKKDTLSICDRSDQELLGLLAPNQSDTLPSCPNPNEGSLRQSGGHAGALKASEKGILKKIKQARDVKEVQFYCQANKDPKFPLKAFMPQFYGVCRDEKGEAYLQMSNAFDGINGQRHLDAKLGTETASKVILEKDKEGIDLYAKLGKHKALDTATTSSSRGFRFEGRSLVPCPDREKANEESSVFGSLRRNWRNIRDKALGTKLTAQMFPEETFEESFEGSNYTDGEKQRLKKCFAVQLQDFRKAAQQGMNGKLFVGSSVLLIHGRNADGAVECRIKMIDFANSEYSPDVRASVLKENQKGILKGIDSLIKIAAY
jgi:hypothetical protein